MRNKKNLATVSHRYSPFSQLIKLFITCLLLGFAQLSTAASFNCAKARTAVEKAICLDSDLSTLDEVMVREYKQVLQQPEFKDLAVRSQRDWRNFLRNPCSDVECIRNAYIQRIEQLRKRDLMGWVNNAPDFAAPPLSQSSVFNYDVAPADATQIRLWLQQNQLLEKTLAILQRSGVVRPNLRIAVKSCKNTYAYYSSSQDIAVLCYELASALAGKNRERIEKGESTKETEIERLYLGLQYVLLHELGHATLHNREAEPTLGRKETEADNFAVALLLRNLNGEPQTSNALWGVWTFYTLVDKSQYGHFDYADEHELPRQRLINFACNLSGKNPEYIKKLKASNWLPNAPETTCAGQWTRINNAVNRILIKLAQR